MATPIKDRIMKHSKMFEDHILYYGPVRIRDHRQVRVYPRTFLYVEEYGRNISHLHLKVICGFDNCITPKHQIQNNRWNLYTDNIKVNDDGCHEWQGQKDTRGYGRFNFNGKLIKVHRYVYEIYIGDIPEGLFICHTCHNPGCVNPNHLYAGTHEDNMEDMRLSRRAAWGERHAKAKLTTKDVNDIRFYSALGFDFPTLALIYGVDRSHIGRIARKNCWKNL